MQKTPDPLLIASIKKQFSTSDVLAHLLAERVENIDEASFYFKSDLSALKNQISAPHLKEFSKIIKDILGTCAEVVISSGSSISSIASSVLLYDFLKAKGADVVLKGAEEFTLLASGIKTPLDKYLLPSSQAARLIATLEGASDSDFSRMLDLVAISIIGDDVSLKGDERLILKFALAELNKRKRLNLQGILCQRNLIGVEITEKDVERYIAPVMQSAIDRGDAQVLIDVLTGTDADFIDIYSRSLLSMNNTTRQSDDTKPNLSASVSSIMQNPDITLEASALDNRLISDIEALSPFGKDNPNPLFLFKGLKVIDKTRFSQKSGRVGCKFKLRGLIDISAILWDTDSISRDIGAGDTIDVLGHIEVSYFRTNKEYRINILNIR